MGISWAFMFPGLVAAFFGLVGFLATMPPDGPTIVPFAIELGKLYNRTDPDGDPFDNSEVIRVLDVKNNKHGIQWVQFVYTKLGGTSRAGTVKYSMTADDLFLKYELSSEQS